MNNRVLITEMTNLVIQMQDMLLNGFDLMTRIGNISNILNENRILQRGFDVYSDSCSLVEKDTLASVYQGSGDEESLLTVYYIYK